MQTNAHMISLKGRQEFPLFAQYARLEESESEHLDLAHKPRNVVVEVYTSFFVDRLY
jgi:hypothetical protein